jgi:AraC family transcriptional regulator
MELMNKVEIVQTMQTYIQTHLNESFTLFDLAQSVHYSPYYCARLFKEMIGMAPFEYVRALRLTKAALTIRDQKVKVIDVAFSFDFGSHEGFTRAFSQYFGITPKQYAKQHPPISLFLPYDIKQQYIHLRKEKKNMSNQEQPNMIFVQVIERPARKAIIKRGVKATHYFEYCEEIGCDVWGILTSIKEALYEPVGMWLPPKLIKKDTSEYVQGVEVPTTYLGIIPEGFDIIDLEPCKMMIFQGQPYNDEDFEMKIGEVMNAIDTYNPNLYGYQWADDIAPRFQLEPQGYRGYIEARPVIEVK